MPEPSASEQSKDDIKESNRTVNIFAIVSFLNDFGSDMIYPIWPLFVTTVLGANLEMLGLIDGLGDAIVSISQAISGYVSDRIRKRKVFIWTGYLFGGVSRIGYALSTAWPQLIPLKILDRAGKMRGSPRDAIIADVSTRENRGANFGLLRTMDNLGAVCGIVTTILLLNYLGYSHLFMIAAVPSLIGVALILLFVKERKTEGIFKGLSLKDLSSNFKLFLLSGALFSVGFFSYSFLLIYASDAGFQTTMVPVLYLLYTIVATILSSPFGKFADETNRKTVMFISYALFAAMSFGFAFLSSSPSMIGVISLFVVYGIHLAARMPVQSAFVSELSPEKYRASTLGAFQMVTGLCALPASLIAGFLWQNFGKATPFYFSFAVTVAAMILLAFVKESERKK
jgi:MFS family permease